MVKSQVFKVIELIAGSDLILPAILLVAYAIFLFVIRGILPSSDELLNLFSRYYARFGYEILFVSALVESLVIVNILAPGQVALALGIIFSKTGETHLPLVMLVVACGVIVGFALDYLIGYYGFADILKRFHQDTLLEKAKDQLEKNSGRAIFISFINANIGSYISLAAGATKTRPVMFFSIGLFAIIFWVCSWSFLIYLLGNLVLMIIRKYALVLSIIFIGVLLISFVPRPKLKHV